jgi:hypothetical protein
VPELERKEAADPINANEEGIDETQVNSDAPPQPDGILY